MIITNKHIEEYSKLPSRRGEKYSPSHIQNIRYAMAYVNSNLDKRNIIEGLSKANVSHNTKFVYSQALIGVGLYYDALSQNDAKEIAQRFSYKSSNWSESNLSEEQVANILEYISSGNHEFTTLRDLTATLLFSSTGMRISQLLEMKMVDIIDGDDYMILNILKLKSKDRENKRSIKLSVAHTKCGYVVADILREYVTMRDRFARSEYVFVSVRNGKRVHITYYQALYRAVGEALRINDLTARKLRHHVGNTVAEKHGVLAAARLLGHGSIQTTQKYVSGGHGGELA